jgi:hypothetical protein
MTVPEASMHEDHFPPASEDEIWSAHEIAPMQAKAVTHHMCEAPYRQLWLAIDLSDASHALAQR